ncbi:MAG: hypothetical protein IJH12_10765 [Clostridia bacterium]|nr:hypothetical protein [Clostridia bacterium]
MSSIKFQFDGKKFEEKIIKEIERDVKKNIYRKEQECGNMVMLQRLEEEMLDIILDKYDGNEELLVSGQFQDFPPKMKLSVNKLMDKLELSGYLSSVNKNMRGWFVTLTPEAISYFQKKGCRDELITEMPDNAKKLLSKLIECENQGGNISELLRREIDADDTDKITRSIIGTLKYNGLIKTKWADDTIYYAELTNEGRCYFEMEKKHMEKLEEKNNVFNIENFINSGVVNTGTMIDSNISINNAVTQLEKEIDTRAKEEEKQELKELVEEVKDYIDNIKENKNVTKNTGLFKRLQAHFEKNQWFYEQVVGIVGQAVLLIMGNQG